MRGHKPPGHPPALYLGASDRRLPAGDGSGPTHQGKGRGGPGGLRVGRPCFPSCKRRKMQDARGSRKNKNTKHDPHPPKNHGENTGKTRQGDPTNPEERGATRAKGEGKHGKGHPTNPEERKKAPLGEKNQKKKTGIDKISRGMPRLVKGVQEGAGPKRGELELAVSSWGQCPPVSRKETTQDIHNKKNKHSCRSCRPAHVIKRKSLRRCTPHPEGVPRKTRTIGRTRPKA